MNWACCESDTAADRLISDEFEIAPSDRDGGIVVITVAVDAAPALQCKARGELPIMW